MYVNVGCEILSMYKCVFYLFSKDKFYLVSFLLFFGLNMREIISFQGQVTGKKSYNFKSTYFC